MAGSMTSGVSELVRSLVQLTPLLQLSQILASFPVTSQSLSMVKDSRKSVSLFSSLLVTGQLIPFPSRQ
jgi:hypothetical protein